MQFPKQAMIDVIEPPASGNYPAELRASIGICRAELAKRTKEQLASRLGSVMADKYAALGKAYYEKKCGIEVGCAVENITAELDRIFQTLTSRKTA